METTNDNLTLEQISKLNITQKIYKVQNEIAPLVKDELNKFQNYKYFDENQILKILKPLLEKYRLLLMISDDDSKELIHEREGNNHFLKYLKIMVITNIDNQNEGQMFKFWACGHNNDLAKAKGSAETYAMKYMLSKFFLIRVFDENDPELKEVGEIEIKKGTSKKELSAEEQKQVEEVIKRHNLRGMTTAFKKE